MQKDCLAHGKELPDVYKPTYVSGGQTYIQLVDNRNFHKHSLNSWIYHEEDREIFQKQNKNALVDVLVSKKDMVKIQTKQLQYVIQYGRIEI